MKSLVIFLALFAVAYSQAQRRCSECSIVKIIILLSSSIASTPSLWSGAFSEVNKMFLNKRIIILFIGQL